MPRNFALRKTSAHPRDTGTFVPYLDSFWELVQPSETPTKTGEILNSYLNYLFARIGSRDLEAQAKSGFRRAFKRLATSKKVRECTYPRGYYIKIPRVTRKNIIDDCVNSHQDDNTPVFERQFIDRKTGYGMFARCDIPANYQIIEYKGEWITIEEHNNRENFYVEAKLPPVAVYNPRTKLMLDGNRDKDGNLFRFGENGARYFNHSKTFPNCKLSCKEQSSERLFLVSKTAIPAGLEITWDYGVYDRDSLASNPWLSR